jgi:phosphatidylglycerol:prolipoprotein diacylglycerol transferase
MSPELINLYGPISIQSYGLMILIGILVFLWRALGHPLRKQYISQEQFLDLLTQGILFGIIGGRALHVITDWQSYTNIGDVFKIWEGGFSILGTVIILALWVPWYLYRHKIPMLPVLDLVSIYSPLLQAISRVGCFLAGCCYGITTNAAWAALCDQRHPTQLYSAGLLLLIFLLLRFACRFRKPGQYVSMYLILIGFERFIVDFWRADRIIQADNLFSYYQWIALGICAVGLMCFVISSCRVTKNYEHI